jgi:hypothetical protein
MELFNPLKQVRIRLSIALISILMIGLILISGCSIQFSSQNTPTNTPTVTTKATWTPSPTVSFTPTPVPTATHTPTPTGTNTPTITPTPTSTLTPSITPTPTFDFPDVELLMQANCRYGPGTAYLYAHGLYEGDRGEVNGRNYSGTWLWIKPENLDWHCWVAASVVEIEGDIGTVAVHRSSLPHSTLYGPPQNVQATRDGDRVVVSWNTVWMTEDDDRGYLIEATICQNGNLISVAVQTDRSAYEFSDEQNCSGASGGRIYTVEKHGYSDPVVIPWP